MKGNLFNPMKSLLAVLLTVIIIFGSIVPVSAQGSLLNDMPQQNSDIIKVVSYNIWTQLMPGTENALELRAERLKQVISQYKPDSIGFQEARYEWMEWLGQNLTDYSYVGVGRENGRIDPECGEASPIFYLKDKFNLLDSGTFWLSETPEIPSIGWDAAYKRICTWAVLENKQTKECYAHINTHLDNVGETARVEGVKLILDKIDELGATYPIVCTGDFNANMYSEPYKLMVEHENEDSGVRMADSLFCAEEVINQGGTMPDINASPMDSELKADGELAIDHCFISANSFDAKLYKVMRDTVDNKYISDHYGVYVELAFGEETGERPMPESPYVENTYNASYGTANIDGIMDASYAAAEVIEVNKRSSGSLASSALATAKVRTIYDNNYIYIFAEVTDNTPNDSTTSSKQGGYGIDGFQIYFDFVNNDSADATEDDYNYESNNGVENHESGHFICYPDGITQPYAEQGAAGYLGDESKLQYRTMKTETGYNVEVRLALSNSLKQRLANDEQNIEIGIGYQINDDSNDDGMRNFDIYCSPRIRDAWKSPLYLDKLVLVSTTPVGQPYIATKGTANIDGVMDDVYKDAQPIWVNRDGSDGIVSDQATATVRTIYDDEFIYCFAKVIDSTPNNENTRPVNNYGVDGVQFFFDFIGNENYTEHESGYIITDLVATDDRKANGGTIGRANQGFSSYVKGKEYDYRAVATEDGYNIEFKLALSESLKNRIASNEQNIKIGIGFQINDDTNDDGNRDKLCYSKGAIKDAWKSNGPSMFDTLILKSEDETVYTITIDENITGGTITVDKEIARVGELVTLTVIPDDGKRLKPNSLKYNNIVITKNSFIMPGRDVIITAEFEDAPPFDYSAYMAAKGTPIVDGIMDDVYKGTQPVYVNKDNANQIVTDAATAQIRTVYDDEFIYCFAKVIDSTPNNENTRPVNNYGVDGVQFFFDFIGNENYTEHESGYIITDLVATDDRKANGGTIGRANQGFSSYVKGKEYDYRAVTTEDGYNIEFKLALSESLKNRIASNEQNIKIGIGFQINDDTNDDGNRDKLCYSKGAIKDAWKKNGPSMLESIYLTGESEVSYHIIVDQMSGGIVSVDKKTAKSGESVRLVVTPNEGYQLKEESLKVNGVIIEGDSFIMPEANVIITAEFEEISMVVDKTQLEALVNESMGKREEDYTPESWSVFQTALDNAQRVLEKQDVTQDEVDDAKNLLQAALDGLKLKDGEPAPVAVLKGSDEVRVGEDFTLTFGLEQAKGITAQEIIITYNTENFELVDVKSVAEGITIVGEDTTDPGSIKIILASEGEDNAVNGDKDIMEIKFKIKKDFGTDIITASKILLADGEGKEVAVAAVSKTVNVVTAITGDVNGDGVVSIADLGIAAKYYGYSSGDSSWEAAKKADIDYNNKIEMADLVFIAKKVLGLE